MEIKLRTLTPLWTGGVDGTMDRIHETGIIGSLRWWYEAIMRGLGGWACDPSKHECPDKDGKFCDVCAVFGSTRLQRMFRLEGPRWRNKAPQSRLTVKVNGNRGWYLGRGFLGADDWQFISLRRVWGWDEDDLWQTILLTLRLIEHQGGLGPKTQQGYGVITFDVIDGLQLDVRKAIDSFASLFQRKERRTVNQQAEWPDLNGFFFAKVRFSLSGQIPKNWIHDRASSIEPPGELQWYLDQATPAQRDQVLPLAPVVRYHLRKLIRDNIRYNGHPNAPARWKLMGVLDGKWHREDFGKVSKRQQGWKCESCNRSWMRKSPPKRWVCTLERQSSQIHVSHAYSLEADTWEFRIWGWIPENLPGDITRDQVLTHLRQWIGIPESQHRLWYPASDGALWGEQCMALETPEIFWFEKGQDESCQAYIHRLCLLEDSERGKGEV